MALHPIGQPNLWRRLIVFNGERCRNYIMWLLGEGEGLWQIDRGGGEGMENGGKVDETRMGSEEMNTLNKENDGSWFKSGQG